MRRSNLVWRVLMESRRLGSASPSLFGAVVAAAVAAAAAASGWFSDFEDLDLGLGVGWS